MFVLFLSPFLFGLVASLAPARRLQTFAPWWDELSLCTSHMQCTPPERCDCGLMGVRFCCQLPGLFDRRNHTDPEWPALLPPVHPPVAPA